ncbi:hypothetical protein AAFF_G00032970 [Aldrovandia affinis]|uniref:DUF4550 domain-containing protein n=1 Tax=Aldrovandia affinis TaxID=143900 RepID=A0AAD7S3I0_9TELE|nr:hypothetical protein AAFF_G00032970 [Aldrovandia affinis]
MVDNNTVQSHAECHQSISSSHEIICTVSIALAINKGKEEDPGNTKEKSKKKEKKIVSTGVVEAPKSQGYYHIEYNLLPDDPEPTKVDLVLFGLAAKIYMENETKVLKPWQEGEKMWLGWSQSVKVKVTKDLLIRLASHKVTFQVWNAKERVSAKARSDRPKAFRLPQGWRCDDPDRNGGPPDCVAAKSGGIKILVQKLRTLFQKENPKVTTSSKIHRDSTSDFKNISELKCVTVKPKPDTVEAAVSERTSSLTVLNKKCSVVPVGERVHTNRSLSCGGEQDALLHDLKSPKLMAIQELEKGPTALRPMQKACSLDQSSKALRPMTRTVISLKKPSSIEDKPQFLPKRRAVKKTTQESVVSGEHIKKNGIALVELSLIHLLAGDKSVTDCLVPCSPGECEGICNISIDKQLISEALRVELNPLIIRILSASSLPTAPVPFHVLEEKCIPVYCQYKFHNMSVHRTGGQEHGSHVYFRDVNVVLSGLLSPGELRECLGGPPLEIEVHDRDRKMQEPPGGLALIGAEPRDDQPSGKKKTCRDVLQDNSRQRNPCGIAKLDLSDLLRGQKYNNTTALTKLRSEILRINAAALRLDSYVEETIETGLGCYRMNAKDRESKDLDVVTGFHVVDGHMHLFILEGLKDKSIKRLWETIPIELTGREEERVEILYNSALSFSNRLYGTLDISLGPIRLHKQLELIMKQPAVYVRDTVSPACLQALSRLSLLLQVKKLRNVVQSSLFPTAEMIQNLSQEFGIIPGRGQQKVTQIEVKNEDEAEVPLQHTTAKTHLPLDSYNIKYVEWKQEIANQNLHGQAKDFIQVNIKEVEQASLRVQRTKPAVIISLPTLNMETRIHSTQTLNCIEQAQEPLCKKVAKETMWRFCCSQEYQLAMALAANAEADQKASEARWRAACHTNDDFRFPGFKSSIESNEHPHRIDEARSEELRKPWRENILHGNTLRPTLMRVTWPWNTRFQDFERYSKPPPFYGPVPPVTIHLAGDSLRQEQLQYYGNVHERSPGKGPVPEFKCHIGVAQGNLGKLQDLLKDKPMKYSLRRPGMVLKVRP